MSHKSLDAFKKQYEEAKTLFYESDKFRDWVYVNAVANAVMFTFLLVIYILVHNGIVNTLVQIGFAISIFFIFVTLHEVLHGVVAQYLGYKCEFKQTPIVLISRLNQSLTTISIDVWHKDDTKWKADSVAIALTPNILFLSIGFSLIVFGALNGFLMLWILGTFTMVGHTIALWIDWGARV